MMRCIFLTLVFSMVFVSLNGQTIIIEPQYDAVRSFSDELAAVKKDGKWGFVNINGREVIPLIYDDVRDFHEGLAAVKTGGKWGYIDKTARMVISANYFDARDFGCGMAPVRTIMPTSNGHAFSDGYEGEKDDFTWWGHNYNESFKDNNKVEWIFIDRYGKRALSRTYSSAHSFSELGLACVVDMIEGKDYIYIDTKGRKVDNPSKGELDGDHIIVNNPNCNLLPDEEALFHEWGYRDIFGKWIIEPKFSRVTTFNSGIAIVDNYGKKCVIDTTGRVLYQSDLGLLLLGNGYVLEHNGRLNLQGKVFHKSDFSIPIYVVDGEQYISDELSENDLFIHVFPPFVYSASGGVSDKYYYDNTVERVSANPIWLPIVFGRPYNGIWPTLFKSSGGNRKEKKWGFSTLNMKDLLRAQVTCEIQNWLHKEEFESMTQYRQRTNAEGTHERMAKIATDLVNSILNRNNGNWSISNYDADNQTFMIITDLGNYIIRVPAYNAQAFKKSWQDMSKQVKFDYDNGIVLKEMIFIPMGGNEIRCVIDQNLKYNGNDVNVSLLNEGIAINILMGEKNNNGSSWKRKVIPSDVDIDIPTTSIVNDKTFVVIISCEDYQRVDGVPFATHDAEVMELYAMKTLGVPKDHIRLLKNATLNDISFNLNWLAKTVNTFGGEARAIVYYAGHGVHDPKSGCGYILPTDGYIGDLNTAFSLASLNQKLAECKMRSALVLVDACFSGASRNENNSLIDKSGTRGIAIKITPEIPQGNVVMFTATLEDQTAYPLNDKSHGLFTYYLLKVLHDSKGDITLGELCDKVILNVRRQSMVTVSKEQTPSVNPSPALSNRWREITIR